MVLYSCKLHLFPNMVRILGLHIIIWHYPLAECLVWLVAQCMEELKNVINVTLIRNIICYLHTVYTSWPNYWGKYISGLTSCWYLLFSNLGTKSQTTLTNIIHSLKFKNINLRSLFHLLYFTFPIGTGFPSQFTIFKLLAGGGKGGSLMQWVPKTL